jgi:hypothetical protein
MQIKATTLILRKMCIRGIPLMHTYR